MSEGPPDAPWRGPDLASGTAGLALVAALEGDRRGARALLEETLALLESEPVGAGLWDGPAGIGWVLEALRQPGEPDPNEATDEIVVDLARGWPEGAPVEWIGGLAGLAAYARMRKTPAARAILVAIVDALARRAMPLGRGVTWGWMGRARPGAWTLGPAREGSGDEAPDARPDAAGLGVAHGLPGVLAGLSVAVEARVPGADQLLDGGLAALAPLAGPGRADAWCNGPLGAGVVLLDLGRRLGRAAATGVGQALVARSRSAAAPPGPGCLCHGAPSARVLSRWLGDEALLARWEAPTARPALPDGAPHGEAGVLHGRAGLRLAELVTDRWLPLFGVFGR